MIRSVLPATVWLIPAFFLAACTSSSSPAEEVKRPSSADSDTGNPTEAVPSPPTIPATKDSPTPTNPPPPEPLTATAEPQIILPDLGPAPDITNEVWLNTDQPLNLAALRGRVVLVEFWTFG
jgi:hypothetical protein